MDFDYRTLTVNSIIIFLESDEQTRIEFIRHVKTKLRNHYLAKKHIGSGFSERFVKGGELFIRWVKIKGLDNSNVSKQL